MGSRVCIVGVGQTVHSSLREDVDVAEMVLEAINEALADAGLELRDVENAVTACMDFWDGRTIANMWVAEVVGSYRKSEGRTCMDAIGAMLYMWTRISTGSFRIGLVTAHCKESAGRIPDIETAATDPFTQRRLGFDGNVVSGLVARYLLDNGRYTREAAAEVVVEARRRGSKNPKLEPLQQVTVDEVLSAPVIADPLRALDRAPNRDGAVALVVVSEDVAVGLGRTPVTVKGVGAITGPYWSDAEPGSTAALEKVYRVAMDMAGWDDHPADLVELSAQFSYQHLLFAPVLGKDPLDPTLNTSGGWLAGNPFVVSGAARIAECVHQLRGTAGDRQLGKADRAVAHGIHGLAAQTHSVVLLEGGLS
ncbi:MAG: hypothetical protein KatS3mg011_2360 [Acidimicrobiia bacterium]|nr:MAG: hypothetical protein KatS3mg011_2360 [Acidimicrobiia bacterium]